MIKLLLSLIIVVLVYVAYTRTDVTKEYESISEIRQTVFDDVVDPLAKKVLKVASESELDQILENSIEKYSGEENEM